MYAPAVPGIVKLLGAKALKPDAPGSTRFVVDYVSDKMEQITGFGLAAWQADPNFWLQRIHTDDRARVAASQGDRFAEKARNDLQTSMPPADLAEAQKLVAEWKPKH